MSKFRSHPDKFLIDHLKEVGEGAENLAPEYLKVEAYVAGSHHDLGKYTPFFQQHLQGKRVQCSDHSTISALIAFSTARKLGLDELSSFLVMTSVKSHHGKLVGLQYMSRWLRTLRDSLRDGDNQCLEQQAKYLLENEVLKEVSSLKYPPNMDALRDVASMVREAWKVTRDIMDKERSWEEFLKGELLFSCLIDADKHSASGNEFFSSPSSFYSLSLQNVERFRAGLSRSSPMASLRDELYNAVKGWDAKGKIKAIISPTGTGKTLAGILEAVKEGKRIIYSLPFISIVEQNYEVATKVFPGVDILKFHHMAFPEDDDENRSTEDKLMMAESWDYPMVVTTFEGLMSTLLSHRNVNLKRLHSLVDSVVILDEVQAIPAEKWHTVKETLKNVSDNLNVTFIFMTATMPRLIQPQEVMDPLKGKEPNRVRVEFRENFVTPEEIAEEVFQISASTPVMVELNTIASAERVAKRLSELQRGVSNEIEENKKGKKSRKEEEKEENVKEEQEERNERKIIFLSTHVTPWDRAQRIKEVKEMLDRREKFILVTTQVVEAGVDVSFPIVYRDFGPLDSVIQASGRCNRNGELGERGGKVVVVRVKRDDRQRSDFSLVYGNVTEEVAKKVLDKYRIITSKKENQIEEKDFRPLLEMYYEELEINRDLRNQFTKWKDWVKLLDYDEVNFSLIQEEPKYSILVLENSEAESRLKQLRDALKLEGYKRRVEVKRARALIEEFVVKVWEKPQIDFDERLELYLAPKEKYDKLTGYRVKDIEESLIW
ncbi:CRISPR-associated helicase Cas3' [Sulfuracidifex metallicus]|uniref:CRISPR-associated helicase Cas3' n=1 Tax=Sulfuracidifex metallicus TaxID=47303 RepID=UPI0022737B8B|nr:CRISPR-associated helicase Cas3' [Sulfuracidifex metallicus]MCY0850242.1 CRISPR-associated helicase Cas3' [Sulfuracidifex metallicus]